MRKIVLIVHVSLDGYVAGPQGDLGYFIQSDANLAFVNSLTVGADSALFGKNSYELLNNFWPERHLHPEATQAEKCYSNWYNAAQRSSCRRRCRTLTQAVLRLYVSTRKLNFLK